MHYTLHLTNNCNMACKYCYVDRKNISVMDFDTAKKAVDMAAASAKESVGIVFFGGEPLLHKQLIYDVVEYCKWKGKNSDISFHFKVTTNGLLLDETFMDFSAANNLFIALSHDGIRKAHDKNRIDMHDCGTFEKLSEKIRLLLSRHPYAPVLMTVNPNTAGHYAESVEYLYEQGFRYIICSINYAGKWNEHGMEALKRQYRKLSNFYMAKTLKEEKFYLSPFEVKISKETYCTERCELGNKQISVAPDGGLFPCVQFVGDEQYCIGNVDTGIDEKKRRTIFEANEKEKESCGTCAIRKRCNHFCGCLNKQATGSIEKVSPVLCMHEKILLPIADRLAEKLYKKRNALFIQKHYNDMFPIISLIEDKTHGRQQHA